MRAVLAQRQPDLTVVLENVHDPHNVSAVLRSCDAVGAASAHLVYAAGELPVISKGVSASAQRWLRLHKHISIDDCYATLRAQGCAIYATYLGAAHDLYALDLTRPTALVFGNESLGVSAAARDGADGTVFIPMMGMVESLNISVACAVALYEALRQRRAAGLYPSPAWSPEELEARLRAWLAREGRDLAAAEALLQELDDPPKPRNRYVDRDLI